MATFGDMIDDLHILTMDRLSDDLIKKFLNRAQAQVCESHDWTFLHTNYVINSVPPHSDGTVTMSRGNQMVIGTGTNFTTEDIGAFMWVGGLNIAPIPISDVQGPSMLTLEFPWSGPTMVNTSYVLAPLYYILEGALEVRTIRQLVELVKTTRERLNAIDPARIAQGGAPALNWAQAPASPDGSVQIEFWPVCTDMRPYLCEIKKKPPVMIELGEVPLVPYEVIEMKALSACFAALFASTGQASYQALSQKYDADYLAAREDCMVQDRRREADTNQVTQGKLQPSWTIDNLIAQSDFGPLGSGVD